MLRAPVGVSQEKQRVIISEPRRGSPVAPGREARFFDFAGLYYSRIYVGMEDGPHDDDRRRRDSKSEDLPVIDRAQRPR